jgi:predicted nucleic acid-binding protein
LSDFSDRFTALIDACCLAGALRRNILLSLAEAGFYRIQWSEKILVEAGEAIAKITAGKADVPKQIDVMKQAFEEAMIDDFAAIEEALKQSPLKDANDAHVIAAAIHGAADIIVTDNIKDFPKTVLDQFGIEAMTADEFIADCIDLNKVAAMSAINKMRKRFNNPKYTWRALCEKAEAQELVQTATAMREFTQIFDEIDE